MRAFSLTVVPWVIRANELVLDATPFKQLLKQCGTIAIRGKSVCEFGTVIGLNTFNLEFEGFKRILLEDSRGKGTRQSPQRSGSENIHRYRYSLLPIKLETRQAAELCLMSI